MVAFKCSFSRTIDHASVSLRQNLSGRPSWQLANPKLDAKNAGPNTMAGSCSRNTPLREFNLAGPKFNPTQTEQFKVQSELSPKSCINLKRKWRRRDPAFPHPRISSAIFQPAREHPPAVLGTLATPAALTIPWTLVAPETMASPGTLAISTLIQRQCRQQRQ